MTEPSKSFVEGGSIGLHRGATTFTITVLDPDVRSFMLIRSTYWVIIKPKDDLNAFALVPAKSSDPKAIKLMRKDNGSVTLEPAVGSWGALNDAAGRLRRYLSNNSGKKTATMKTAILVFPESGVVRFRNPELY